jgi:hypothetical protein
MRISGSRSSPWSTAGRWRGRRDVGGGPHDPCHRVCDTGGTVHVTRGYPSAAWATVQPQGALSGIGDRHRRATTHVRHSEEAWGETILGGLSWLLLVLLTTCIASHP